MARMAFLVSLLVASPVFAQGPTSSNHIDHERPPDHREDRDADRWSSGARVLVELGVALGITIGEGALLRQLNQYEGSEAIEDAATPLSVSVAILSPLALGGAIDGIGTGAGADGSYGAALLGATVGRLIHLAVAIVANFTTGFAQDMEWLRYGIAWVLPAAGGAIGYELSL